MKRMSFFVVLLVVCLTSNASSARSVTVVDQVGRTVRVKQPVARVVTTFIPSTVFALVAGLKGALVGASSQDSSLSIYDAVMGDLPQPVLVGNRSIGLNLETIVSLKPDLVIMYGQKDGVRVADKLTALGIPAIVIVPETLEDMVATLNLIGQAAGTTMHTDKVVAVMAALQQRIDAKVSGLKMRPKLYYATGSLLRTVSGEMLQNEMITRAGGINVSQDTQGFFVSITREQLLAWNPDALLCSGRLSDQSLQELYSPELSGLAAVKKQAVFRFPKGTYWDFPSSLSIAGVLWLGNKLHPQEFSDIDVQGEITTLYDTIFGDGFSQQHPYVVGVSR